MSMRFKAAFFDRDGTLIKDVNYLSKFSDIKILPGIIDLCLFLQKLDYKLFVVTNQSGIARGYFDEEFVIETHRYLGEIFKKCGVYFSKFYYCPHHPKVAFNRKYLQKCSCRKPKPGMFTQASNEFYLDLSKSIMFGDKSSDIIAGKKANCKSFSIQDVLGEKIEFLRNKF